MSEETVVAASSAEVQDVFEGKQVSMEEYDRYRKDGELPERFKPAENAGAAPAATSEETTESETVGESETPEITQEKTERKPKQTAAERIAELQSTIEKIRKGAGLDKTQAAESSPARSEPVQQQPQIAPTRTKPTLDGSWPDGRPYEAHEDWVEDLTDWKLEQQEASKQREQTELALAQAEQARANEFIAKVEEARGRYENFDEVVQPAAIAINGDPNVSPVIKDMLNKSDYLADVLFTIGSDPAELAKFVAMAKQDPAKAIRYMVKVESLIEAQTEKARDENGQFAAATPAKPTTKAPKPPAPVGGASSRAFDVSDESLSADEWARKRTADLARR